jgi:small-conductance mechanosensitive channel
MRRAWRGEGLCLRPIKRRAPFLLVALIVHVALMWPSSLGAQVSPAPDAAAVRVERSGQSATFVYANRPIVTLRARVFGRGPDERARGAERILDDLVVERVRGPVQSQSIDGGTVITVASRIVVGLTPADVDELAGETVEGVAAQTVARLQQALDEAIEARTTNRLVVASVLAIAALVAGLLLLWGIVRAHRRFVDGLIQAAERKITASGFADVSSLRASRLLEFQRRLLTAMAVGLGLFVAYSTLTFVLRRFPYTRPWGESMRGYLLSTFETLGLGVVNAIPGLFTVVVIFVITRVVSRLMGFWFKAIEEGRTESRWIYPETAQTTRRLAAMLLWLFAIVVAYPYMPGSETEAFKGISVFLGLMVTFGSTGLVNQIMSGLMLTYSRALRVGDVVRIGDIEGTVMHLGVLSTKVRSFRGEECTIPNAVVVGQTTTDYSRYADTGQVFTPTSVTIGYDAPWRQVQALLLLAAERTAGVRKEPKPIVLQVSLEDFYVKYTLLVCLEHQGKRALTLHDLHANIQDLFNEHGVQIMSPHYESDPAAPKVVARQNWHAAPAIREPRSPGDQQQPWRSDDQVHAQALSRR